jgi:hypothetical protein
VLHRRSAASASAFSCLSLTAESVFRFFALELDSR